MQGMNQLPMAQASDDQLRDFAKNSLQIDIGAGADRATLEGTIARAWPHQFILAADEDVREDFSAEQTQAVQPVAGQILSSGGYKDDPIVRLKIGQTDMPGGKDPVPVSVNGDAIVIQRNLVADCPYRFFEALRNAKRIVVDQVLDGPDRGELIETPVTNYPIAEIISQPTPDEIDAWRARTADLPLAA